VAGSPACGSSELTPTEVAAQRGAIVYDADGRQEVFEASEELQALAERSIAALIPRVWLDLNGPSATLRSPSRAELAGVCRDERFAEQPAAAFCTGVLVDWDLLLTAGHCARAYPLDELAVVFGYYYRAPGELGLSSEDVFGVSEVVAASFASEGGRSVRDHAFLRLDHAPDAPRAPAPIRTSHAALGLDTPLISVGASEGVPLKIDLGGSIRELPGADFEHFVADTDTAKGGSGGGAFDGGLALLGVLFSGGEDLVHDSDCARTQHVPAAYGAETFAFAGDALERLCAADPGASTLCRSDCGDPCQALKPGAPSHSCTLMPGHTDSATPSCWLAISALALLRRRRAC